LTPESAGLVVGEYKESFRTAFKALGGGMKAAKEIDLNTKSDVWSRDNAINGRYFCKEGKLDIAGMGEEGTPKSWLEGFEIKGKNISIPLVSRLTRATRLVAETASMRLRANLADKFYEQAERQGKDLSNPVEVGAINLLVNQMTGRGTIGKLSEGAQAALNESIFSAKFAKSTLETFTNPFTAKTKFARDKAMYNLVSLAVSTAIINSIAYAINPDSVETDPTSSDFGQIKSGSTRIDTTGGIKTILVLGTRLAALILKKSIKSAITGISKVGGGYGAPDAVDYISGFAANKLAPMFSLFLNLLKGETREGKSITLLSSVRDLFEPLIFGTGFSGDNCRLSWCFC
jgi:hypothetical protein